MDVIVVWLVRVFGISNSDPSKLRRAYAFVQRVARLIKTYVYPFGLRYG